MKNIQKCWIWSILLKNPNPGWRDLLSVAEIFHDFGLHKKFGHQTLGGKSWTKLINFQWYHFKFCNSNVYIPNFIFLWPTMPLLTEWTINFQFSILNPNQRSKFQRVILLSTLSLWYFWFSTPSKQNTVKSLKPKLINASSGIFIEYSKLM